MTSMPMSRIPIPVRNFQDVAQLRTISAKTRLEQLKDEYQRKLLLEKHGKLFNFYERRYQQQEAVANRQRFATSEIGYGPYRNPRAVNELLKKKDAAMNDINNADRWSHRNLKAVSDLSVKKDSVVNNMDSADKWSHRFPSHQNGLSRKPPIAAFEKRSPGWDRSNRLAPINQAKLSQKSTKMKNGHFQGNTFDERSPDVLDDTYTVKNRVGDNAQQKIAPHPPGINSKPRVARPYVPSRQYKQVDSDSFDGDSVENRDRGRRGSYFDKERMKQDRLRQLNEGLTGDRNRSVQVVGDRGRSRGLSSQGETDDEEYYEVPQTPVRNSKPSVYPTSQAKPRQERTRPFQRHADVSGEDEEARIGHWPSSNTNRREAGIGLVQKQKQGFLGHQKYLTDDDDDSEQDSDDDVDLRRNVEDERLKEKEMELQELIQRQEKELQKLRRENLNEDQEQKRKQEEKDRKEAEFNRKKQQIVEAEVSSQKPRRQSITTGRRMSDVSIPPKQPWQPEVDPNNEETAFYLERAITEGDQGAEGIKLKSCPVCGRSFASDRLPKHEKICSKGTKATRKVFDHVAMRYRGTAFENHFKRRDSVSEETEVEKKSLWRTRHQNFIENIQYAKKVAKIESEGGDIASLPPPPVTVNPDYIQCPHCQRRFNAKAADRHIPWCKESMSRQAQKTVGRRL